ncbi:MAG: hypothetical protein H6766_06890 [Candidatus Peribacteria bacterium]|nr:MAG: hypothetical protein H6766_06890 [Candidatus Peribacteria bacterium]
MRTDLIPGMHIRIPPIVVNELRLFGSLAIVVLVILGLYNGLYKLRGVPRYRNLFVKTRGQRFAAIIFMAYLGSGFIFSGGISRWIILVVGIGSLFVLSLFDIARNYCIGRISATHPVRVLCIYWKDSQQDTIDRALLYKNYYLTRLPASQRRGHEDY